MGIIQLPTPLAAENGLKPATKKMVTTDNLATITAAGYLNAYNLQGFDVSPSDILEVLYSYDEQADSGTYALFLVSISGTGVITLTEDVSGGNVVLPVVSGDFANFTGTDGKIKDDGFSASDATKTKVVMANGTVIANHMAVYVDTAGTISDDAATAINGGNIQAGLSGTEGFVQTFPPTANSGSLALKCIDNSADVSLIIQNEAASTNKTFNLVNPTGLQGYIQVSNFPSDPSSNLIGFTVVVGFAALAGASVLTVFASSGTKEYQIRDLRLGAGTDFAGGGGDRDATISDGTTTYSVIPAATLQSLVNANWGSTSLPYPAAPTPLQTNLASGAALTIQYSGGTTDYTTAGSMIISGMMERLV